MTRYSRSDNYELASIAGENFLVPCASAVIDLNNMLDLNEMGAFIMTSLKQEPKTAEELAACIIEEYDVDFDTALSDANKFLEIGCKAGFLNKMEVTK